MKKALFIMAAALMTMTQCKKQETVPVTPSANTIKMTVTAGSGAKTDINTETGAITWSEGDKLYVSKNGSWLGCLELVSGENTANGTFAGDVTGIGDGDTPCHFFYLGKGNIATTPTGTAAVSISLASQDGTLAGAMKYHAGYGRTDVTVTEGEATGYVIMDTKIAIAHINFTTDGTTAYTGSVTMGGTGVSNTLTVSPDGSFSGGDGGGITIDNGNGTTGERFVTLIPTGTTDVLSVAFTGDATGGMTFANGIQANKFYGMKDAVKVTVTPKPRFSVADGTKVDFSPGNLYWDGGAFRFEEDQWSSASTWDTLHVSHFFWSNTTDWQESGKEPYASSYSYSTRTTSDVFFTEAEGFQVGSETDWRTLSKDEWAYLINTRSGNRFAKAKVSGVTGLLIFPDVYSGTTSGTGIAAVNTTNAAYPGDNIPSDTWATMESAGAVFLPAAGYRYGTGVYGVGSYGYYWSSTPVEDDEDDAYLMRFYSGNAGTSYGDRDCGYAVRLVR